MIFDAFVLFFAIFKRKLVQVLSFDKVRKALTWMHILVDLHKHFVRLSYHSACQLAIRECLLAALEEMRLITHSTLAHLLLLIRCAT